MAKDKGQPPGWYVVEGNDYQWYWDGASYTEHRSLDHPCGYCRSTIPRDARRCAHCAGEFRYCKNCQENVALRTKEKFVGLARGGIKTQYRCAQCNGYIDGPMF